MKLIFFVRFSLIVLLSLEWMYIIYFYEKEKSINTNKSKYGNQLNRTNQPFATPKHFRQLIIFTVIFDNNRNVYCY